jgi:CBS domain-containing protein
VSPQEIKRQVVRDAPLLRVEQAIPEAVRDVLDTGLPALPVVDSDERLAGIFGEREFITALFPGYLGELRHAGFVKASIDDVIQKRLECAAETVGQHMNTEKVAAAPDASDVQLAETFLHHRVLIIPIVDGAAVRGVVTRADFFRALGEKFVRSTAS